MNKKLISILLSLILLFALALPVYADETEEPAVPVTAISVRTVEDLLALAENCRLDSYSQNLQVSLETDLDLTGAAFDSIPVFNGTFLGNGHTVTGLSLTGEGSVVGFFRYLGAAAVVKDLRLEGDIHPQGSRSQVGALAGHNEGYILNCSFIGTVSGGDYIGGLVGRNAVTGIIENGRTEGDIHGNHFVGGITGDNSGVLRGCKNYASVNTTSQQNTVDLADITLDTMSNSEAVNTATDIGGITGLSTGVIRECENHADVGYRHMGYNIGGIAGTQSGYMSRCVNHGNIQGRKEVGGIVGQMEPVTRIEYTEDTLQILQGQLDTMSGMVGQVSANAQTNAGEITANMELLKEQTETARDAVATLIPSEENPELPDADAILAAQNTLSSAMNAIPGTMGSIAAAADATVNGLTRDLQALSGQINAMGRTINEAADNLGGSITDISDLDTEEMLTGKITGCSNFGSILADLNVGGIAGAMAMENDLDILTDWVQEGEESLNFASEVRAVIRNCRNHGDITGKKQNVGGIVGWQLLGLVKNSENDGQILAEGADYAGGIAGISTGFIRSSYAKCQISGGTYVGGIAGSADVVTDSLSQVQILSARENVGAILGSREAFSDAEDPFGRNRYLIVGKDLGGVDGISYAGLAEPMALDAFLAQEDLPEMFKRVNVRFVFEDGNVMTLTAVPGGAVDTSKIPDVPDRNGSTGVWKGLKNVDLQNIEFDLTFEAEYTAHYHTIATELCRENGRPIALVEGAFTSEAFVTVESGSGCPALEDGQMHLESWKLHMSEAGRTVRFLMPENAEAERVLVYVSDGQGRWELTDTVVDGSYLVFSAAEGDLEIALVEAGRNILPYLAAAAAAVLLTAAVILGSKRKK